MIDAFNTLDTNIQAALIGALAAIVSGFLILLTERYFHAQDNRSTRQREIVNALSSVLSEIRRRKRLLGRLDDYRCSCFRQAIENAHKICRKPPDQHKASHYLLLDHFPFGSTDATPPWVLDMIHERRPEIRGKLVEFEYGYLFLEAKTHRLFELKQELNEILLAKTIDNQNLQIQPELDIRSQWMDQLFAAWLTDLKWMLSNADELLSKIDDILKFFEKRRR